MKARSFSIPPRENTRLDQNRGLVSTEVRYRKGYANAVGPAVSPSIRCLGAISIAPTFIA